MFFFHETIQKKYLSRFSIRMIELFSAQNQSHFMDSSWPFTFLTGKFKAKCCRGLGLWWEFCTNLSLASFYITLILNFLLISSIFNLCLFNSRCLKFLIQVGVKCW